MKIDGGDCLVCDLGILETWHYSRLIVATYSTPKRADSALFEPVRCLSRNVLERYRISSNGVLLDSSHFCDARMSFDILRLFSKPYSERVQRHVISDSVLRGGVSEGRYTAEGNTTAEEDEAILCKRTRVYADSDVRRIH